MTLPALGGALPRRASRPLPRPFALGTALLLGLGACTGSGGGDSVVFGLAGPMEEGYGQTTRMGAELAVKEINAAGGIDGRKVELRIKDDQASAERAITVAEELLGDPEVVAVAGHVNSGTTRAAAATYQKGLPTLATTATSPEISRLGEWVFRVASSDSANAVALARSARSIARKTAILYANDSYGRGLSKGFGETLRKSGGTVVEMDPYLETTEDFRPYLARLKQRGVDLVFVAGLETGAARIISQARELGLEARFLGGDGLEPLVGMGPAYDGAMVGLLFHPESSDEAKRFTEAFRKEFGRAPDSFAAAAYDAVRLLALAADEGGAERGAIREYLAGVGRPGGADPFQGATGSLRFDENGDPVEKAFAVGTIRNGTIQLNRESR